MTSPYHTALKTGLAAVRDAAGICQEIRSNCSSDAMNKQDHSPVTVADFASQALICRQLSQAFPDDPVIAEEAAEELKSEAGKPFLEEIVRRCENLGIACRPADVCEWIDHGRLSEYRDRFWTLDPVDGTKGFLRNDQYAISLALIENGRIVLGILGCPNLPLHSDAADGPRGVLAWALAGQGSWMQPLDAPETEPIRLSISDTDEPSRARFCESVESGHSSHDWSAQIAAALNIDREPFRIDSQCKYLAVARGDADIYLRLPTRPGYQEKIWDHAGGVIIVTEAGGTVTDIHGAAPDFTRGRTLAGNTGMVVTNGQFHQQVLQAVQSSAPP